MIQAAGVSPRWLEGGASRLPRFRRDVRKAVAAHGLELIELAVEDLLAWAERERIESPPAALNRCIEKRVEDRANPIPLPPVRRQRRPDPLPAPVAPPLPGSPHRAAAVAPAAGAFGSSSAIRSNYANLPPHRLPAMGSGPGSQNYDPDRGCEVFWFVTPGAPNASGSWMTRDEYLAAKDAQAQATARRIP